MVRKFAGRVPFAVPFLSRLGVGFSHCLCFSFCFSLFFSFSFCLILTPSASFAKELTIVKNPTFSALDGWDVRREGRGILRVEYRHRPQEGLFLDGRRGFGEPSLVAATQYVDVAQGAQLRMECLLTILEHDGGEGGAMVGLYGGKDLLWKRVFRPKGEGAAGGKEAKSSPKAHEVFIEVGKPFRYVSGDLSFVVAKKGGTKLVVGALGHRYSVLFHSVQFFVAEDLLKKKEPEVGRAFRVHAVQELPGAGSRGPQYVLVSFVDGESGLPLRGVTLRADGSRWLEDGNEVGHFEVGPVDAKKKQQLQFSHPDYLGGSYTVRCSPPFVTLVRFALYRKVQGVSSSALRPASVVGRVLRGLTTRPLGDVSLSLNGKILNQKTDLAGRFRIAHVVPNEEQVLVFTLPGYKTVRRTFKAAPGERLQLLVGLTAKGRLR